MTTRRDYNLIAGALFRRYHTEPANSPKQDAVGLVALELANTLKTANARFDVDQFLDAVRYGTGLAKYETRNLLPKVDPSKDELVGQGATYRIGSDRYPATIVAVTRFKSGTREGQPRAITVQEDESTVVSGSQHDGSAVYEYQTNPKAPWRTFLATTTGRYMRNGSSLSVGIRSRYYDPHV